MESDHIIQSAGYKLAFELDPGEIRSRKFLLVLEAERTREVDKTDSSFSCRRKCQPRK